MGLYDEVDIACPKCSRINYMQSKAGDCDLKTYNIRNAPPEILTSLAKNTFVCYECGSTVGIHVMVMANAYIVEEKE